jgi:hypothetical protein
MPVEMIRREIGHHGHMRTDLQPCQIAQLETAQLKYHQIARLDLIDEWPW